MCDDALDDVPGCTDVGELESGKRDEGYFSGIMTFMRGLSSAVGLFIVSGILDFPGYIKPMEQVVDGKIVEVLMEQPQAVITALKVIAAGFPFILLIFTHLLAKNIH